jgi:DNA-directed RNA polymerase specialized sigma24 family protein
MNQKLDEDKRWHEIWDLYKEHGPALFLISRAICRQDPRLGPEDAEDLVHSFVLDRLPRVAEASRGLPQDSRRQYLRASFRNFLRSAARERSRHATALDQLSRAFGHVQPESRADIDKETLASPAEVHAEVVDLPPDLLRPAALYLGISGPPQSIRNIARSLNLTRYLTRLAVIDGLVAIAVQMRARGLLSDRELEAARLVLLEGRDMEEAARRLRLTTQQVRGALGRARTAVAAHMRRKG